MASIHLITQCTEDDCGLSWPDFTPEAYVDENDAKLRFEYLKANLGKWTGLYYKLEEIELIEK